MNEDEKKDKDGEEINSKNAVEERMKNLSKGKKDAEEKAEAETKAKAEAETKAQLAEKERDFYKDFSTSVSKYPSATEFQDAIKEKVMSGYSVEDATVSVLAKEGKLQTSQGHRQSAAGGSAVNSNLGGGAKSTAEMTREDRRKAIMEAESKGDISLS